MEYAIIILSLVVICLVAVNVAVICLVAVKVIDCFWHKRIEHRLDQLDGASLNNMRRQKNMQHEDLLK